MKTNEITSSNGKAIFYLESKNIGIGKKKYSLSSIQIFSIIFYVLGALLILLSLLMLPIGLIFTILGVVVIMVGSTYSKYLKDFKKALESNSNCENVENHIDNKDINNNLESSKTETYHLAGVSFRQDAIFSMAKEDYLYNLTKKEMIEECDENEKIYQYYFDPRNIELIPEPTNEYDPNAVKVIIDNVHVGYIKKGSCSHIKKLITEDKILKLKAEIHGGKYKILSSYYDDDKDKDVYEIEKGETNFFVTVFVTIK